MFAATSASAPGVPSASQGCIAADGARAVKPADRPQLRRAGAGGEPASDLVEAFVLRDASDRIRIQRPEAFRHLLEFVAGQVGQMANYAEWASHIGVAANTVRDWMGLLEECWIVRRLTPFAGGLRREITGAPRVHFYDLGLRNSLLGMLDPDLSRRPDRGALAEGWAFGELAKSLPADWSLHYWRAKGGAELDLVVVRGRRVIGVEVKAGRIHRVSRSVRSFIDAYAPEAVILAGQGQDESDVERVGATDLVTMPLERLATTVLARLDPPG